MLKPLLKTIIDFRTVEKIGDTRNGDWIRFDNFPDYIEKAGKYATWQAENVVKIGDDKYWGHGAGDKNGLSEKQWLEALRENYIRDTNTSADQVKDLPPGYAKNEVWFVDVAKVASDLFNYRASQTATRTPKK